MATLRELLSIQGIYIDCHYFVKYSLHSQLIALHQDL